MMQSPQEQWPPNYLGEFNRRFRLNKSLLQSERTRRFMWTHYKHNPIDFINDWCITHDPRNSSPLPKLMPFRLFPRQREFIYFLQECLRDKECGLVEKARDMGATWLCCAFSIWLWIFWPGSIVGWGSRKEEYVDKRGDPKAIFTKLRQLIENLPSWLVPAGYDPRKHSTHMSIVNPENGSAITGEAGDNIGRGGRTTIYFKDEAAHYERPELIEAALGDNTDVQIDISSVNGSANVFYNKQKAAVLWGKDEKYPRGKTRKFIMAWQHHPNKNQEWHDIREKKYEDDGLLHVFRQEVDRDYAGSITGVIIKSEWVEAAIDAHVKLGFGDDGEKVAGQDVADGGKDKNALAIRNGVVLRFCHDWGGESGDAAQIAIPHCAEWKVKELFYDSIGVGAGFKTEINNMKKNANWPRMLKVYPWNAGASPIDPDKHIIPHDKESAKNEDQYANLKAQAWFRLRTRFYKTYKAIKNGDKYDSADLISLDSRMPKIHDLKSQLSQATYDSNGKGKTVVDKTPDSTFSPNLADAIVICYCPTKPPAGFFS